jgi:hypothetical protein
VNQVTHGWQHLGLRQSGNNSIDLLQELSNVVCSNSSHHSATGSLSRKTRAAPALDQQWCHCSRGSNRRSSSGWRNGDAGDGLSRYEGATTAAVARAFACVRFASATRHCQCASTGHVVFRPPIWAARGYVVLKWRLSGATPQDRHRPAIFASEERERELASDSQPSANSWSRGDVRRASIFTGCFTGSGCNAGTTGKRSLFPLRFTISPAITPVSAVQLKRMQESSGVRWAVPLAEAVANIRAANKMAFMDIPLKCQMPPTQQCPVRLSAQRAPRDRNRANAVQSWCLPLFKRPILLGSQSVFTPPLFQSYFDAKFFGFVVWGKNLASVSQFVTEIRP